MMIDHSLEKLVEEYRKITGDGTWYQIKLVRKIHSLEDYPWLKGIEHLKRVNRYRKRVGQDPIRFDEDDMADLILLREG